VVESEDAEVNVMTVKVFDFEGVRDSTRSSRWAGVL